MATQLPTLFNAQDAVPAHTAQFFDEVGSNITSKQTVNSLSPGGKLWTLSIDGQKTVLQRNVNGDMEPLPIMKVVILDYAKQRGRQYYAGDFDPNKTSQPICWSDDGVAPDASLPGPFPDGTAIEPGKSHKISTACATCPMAVKGSKIAQGKSVTACSQHLMVAVLPDPQLGMPPMAMKPLRLKLAMTSIWDKESPDEEMQGWLAFDNYRDWLLARQVKHTAAVVTKMKFDNKVTYPKVFFSAERRLDGAELDMIKPMLNSDEVKNLLGGKFTPAGADGIPHDQQDIVQPPAAAPAIQAAPTQYVMAPSETFTREQYHAAGWSDEQLLKAGKMAGPTAPAAPAATMVVAEPAPAADPPVPAAVLAPAAMVIQEPAQAAAPPPTPVPPKSEPPAAAAAAATVTPPTSTEVPTSLEGIMAEWK